MSADFVLLNRMRSKPRFHRPVYMDGEYVTACGVGHRDMRNYSEEVVILRYAAAPCRRCFPDRNAS